MYLGKDTLVDSYGIIIILSVQGGLSDYGGEWPTWSSLSLILIGHLEELADWSENGDLLLVRFSLSVKLLHLTLITFAMIVLSFGLIRRVIILEDLKIIPYDVVNLLVG